MKDQTADLQWRADALPVSTRFDDPYFSLQDGLAEKRYVFVQGNRLESRFDAPLHVAELGFGTGLGFLATLQAWRAAGARAPLAFTSFERFPMAPEDIARALAPFRKVADLARLLRDALRAPRDGMEIIPGARLHLRIGDARRTLPAWSGCADAWYLDGFAPAKNPELWTSDLMQEVARHTAPGGTFATYTAAGGVRRALAAAGFEVERVPGFGAKRHMTRGRRP